MAEAGPQKRVLPPRERRESKRLRGSPATRTPAAAGVAAAAAAAATPGTPTPATASDSRGKRAAKKRSSLPVTTTPSNASASPAPAPEETLPTKLTSSAPLPSTRTKPPALPSKRDFQSIADSAVLAASLHRSRMQWLLEGIFEKYWVKPVKRKGVVDVPPGNPDVKSMQKMGNGTLTIEPHRFDVTFYVVRDTQTPAVPIYRPPNPPPPRPKPAVPYSAPTPTPTPTPHHAYHPITAVNGAPATPATPAPPRLPAPVATAAPTSIAPSQPPPRPVVKQEPINPSPAQRQPAAPEARPPAPKTAADPVIQMLAARAASDPQLKELMKVVATSKASIDQLKEFQRHIDELNEVVRRQQEAERAAQQQQQQQKAKQPPPPPPPPPHPTAPRVAPSAGPAAAVPPHTPYNAPPSSLAAAPASAPSAAATPTPTMAPQPHYSPYLPQPRPEALIKHIVVEFHGEGSSADRWLFPEHAVLDIRYGGLEMSVSFFVERKGSEIIKAHTSGGGGGGGGGGSDEERQLLASKWQADTDYYQPVTMHVRANQHKTIETIARGAKTLPVVQEYMKKVMHDKTRAPVEYLVHQLPREKPDSDFEDSAVEMASGDDADDDEGEDDVLQDYYGN